MLTKITLHTIRLLQDMSETTKTLETPSVSKSTSDKSKYLPIWQVRVTVSHPLPSGINNFLMLCMDATLFIQCDAQTQLGYRNVYNNNIPSQHFRSQQMFVCLLHLLATMLVSGVSQVTCH